MVGIAVVHGDSKPIPQR